MTSGEREAPGERDGLLRILDANRNRCLEALRVIEDQARFAHHAPSLARRLKELRHEVQRALAGPAFAGLLRARDVQGDPGHPDVAPDRRGRGDLADVLGANLSRAKESLRVLEEHAKLLDGAAALRLSRARYALYDLEPELLAPARDLERRAVYVLLGSAPGRASALEQARACLEGGVRLFQLREKGRSDRDVLALARQLVALLAPAGAWLLLNDRPDLARLAGAQGVHLGRDDLPASEARRLLGPDALIGASSHDPAELRSALAEGASYVGFGTLFSSPTKPALGAQGLEQLRALAPECPVPCYGIGGVTRDNAAQVIAAGASGVAVSSAVLDAPDPAAAAAELIAAVAAARAARGLP